MLWNFKKKKSGNRDKGLLTELSLGKKNFEVSILIVYRKVYCWWFWWWWAAINSMITISCKVIPFNFYVRIKDVLLLNFMVYNLTNFPFLEHEYSSSCAHA